MRILILAFAFLLTNQSMYAQDPEYSQYYSNPVYLNPALAGIMEEYQIILNHRNQWSKPITYNTSSFSFEGRFNDSYSGWGVQFIQDNLANGLIKQSIISSSFAHRIQINKHQFIGLGLKFGIYQKRIDLSNLIFEDQLDNRYGNINPTEENVDNNKTINPDISAGILYYSEKLYGGISINHINRPAEGFDESDMYRLPVKYTFHAGSLIELDAIRSISLSPNIIYERQGNFNYVSPGLFITNEKWMSGIWYRIKDAVILTMSIHAKPFKIGYSYDVGVTTISSYYGNTHELTLTYSFKKKPKEYNKDSRYRGKCPEFYKTLFR